MADLTENEASGITRITGKDELHNADVSKNESTSKNELNVSDELIREILVSRNSDHNEMLCAIKELQKQIMLIRHKKNYIENGNGDGKKIKINKQNAIKVYNQSIPDAEDKTLLVPLTGFFLDDNGNQDARVDGSVNPIDFCVKSKVESDVYLSGISFKIADQNAVLNEFGNIGSLSQGLQLIYKNEDIGERILIDNIRSNFDLIRACQGYPAFGSGEAFRANNVQGPSEGYLPVLKIGEVFNLPFGIRLQAGKKDQLIVRIRDNLSGVDAFDIFYYANENIN